MSYYLIKKRLRGELPVYCAEVIQKRKGQKMFSKSKTFITKGAATKWAKVLVDQLEDNEAMNLLGLREELPLVTFRLAESHKGKLLVHVDNLTELVE